MSLVQRILTSLLCILILGGFVFWKNSPFQEANVKEVDNLLADIQAKRLFAVFAHPDDELTSYTLLNQAKSAGTEIYILTLTKGEKGYNPSYTGKPEDLGEVRMAELTNSIVSLGIDKFQIRSYPDGDLISSEEQARALIKVLLCEFQPDTILTFEPHTGFTGHPDHRAAGHFILQEVQNRNSGTKYCNDDTQQFRIKNVIYPLMPREAMLKFGGEKEKTMFQNVPAPTHAIKGDRELKVKGWEIHHSQRDFVRQHWKLPPWLLYVFYNREFYRVEKL